MNYFDLRSVLNEREECRLIRVIDGDTIVVEINIPLSRFYVKCPEYISHIVEEIFIPFESRVRLSHIDAYPAKDPKGIQATKYLTSLIERISVNGSFSLITNAKQNEPHGRILASLAEENGRPVNKDLLTVLGECDCLCSQHKSNCSYGQNLWVSYEGKGKHLE